MYIIYVGTSFQLYFQEMNRQEILFTEYQGDTRNVLNLARAAQGKQILLVDDDKEVRAAIEAMLRRLGCEVIVASDGREGLKLYRRWCINIF